MAEPVVCPWPVCPGCGRHAVEASVGTLTRSPGGMAPVRTQGNYSQGPRFRCALGHWFTREGVASGPPVDVTVQEWPR